MMNPKSRFMLIGMSIGAAVGSMLVFVFNILALPICVSLGMSLGTLYGSVMMLN